MRVPLPALHIHHKDDLAIHPRSGVEAHAILLQARSNADMKMIGGIVGFNARVIHWMAKPTGFEEVVRFLGDSVAS